MREREGKGKRDRERRRNALRARVPLAVLQACSVAVTGRKWGGITRAAVLRGVTGGAAPVQDASHAPSDTAAHVAQREPLF